jgi:hypothetical protein
MASDAYFFYVLAGMNSKPADSAEWINFPNENPSAIELKEWLRVWSGLLDQCDWGAVARDGIPTSLLALSSAFAETNPFTVMVRSQTEPEKDDVPKLEAHNWKSKQWDADKALKEKQFAGSLRGLKAAFAAQIDTPKTTGTRRSPSSVRSGRPTARTAASISRTRR